MMRTARIKASVEHRREEDDRRPAAGREVQVQLREGCASAAGRLVQVDQERHDPLAAVLQEEAACVRGRLHG
jgi:hypothetical protein